MRTTFLRELVKTAEKDPRIFLIVGDLGYSVVEPFRDKFPGRFLNVGVAEQNMTGVAAGLSREGFKVFTYSIANFPTLRCLEQIRNDVCYHGLDVTVVAVGGGFMYGSLGASHYATEDIGILRVLPNLRIYAPSVPEQLHPIMEEILTSPGPAYLRLGRSGEFPISNNKEFFEGGWVSSRNGGSNATVTMGNVGSIVRKIQKEEGADRDLWITGRVKPFPEIVAKSLARYREILTIEDHQRSGGLGSLLAEQLCISRKTKEIPLFRGYAIPDRFPEISGKEGYIQESMMCIEPNK
jgi:transketolase